MTYGPITSSDTLWSIAQGHRQGTNFTVYQVMVAIQQLNPTAFENGNINRLLDGKILTLPPDSYIATINPQEAMARATFDIDSSQSAASTKKPVAKIASTEDLSETKASIENQINKMDEQRHRQFVQLKDQLAASIRGLESLLSENNRINERLDGVNAEIENLRAQVGEDGEVPQQMQRLLALQNEVLLLSQQERDQKIAEEKRSIFSNPLWLVLASTIPVIMVLAGLAYWLKRRQPAAEKTEAGAIPPAAEQPLPERSSASEDLSDDLDDDLSGELFEDDLFGGDELLDESVEEELLTEPLTEEQPEDITSDLDDFDDLTDELLDAELDSDDFAHTKISRHTIA